MHIGESEEHCAEYEQANHEEENKGDGAMVKNFNEEDDDVVFVTYCAAPLSHSPEHIGSKPEQAGLRKNSYSVKI